MIGIFIFAALATAAVLFFRMIYMLWEVFSPPRPKPQAEYMTTNLKPHWDK